MAEPRVTVIIACYNDEEFIKKAIKSATNQDYQGSLTICVINDGSTDSSWGLISPSGEGVIKDIFEGGDVLMSSDKKFIVIDRVNGGPSAARNTGIRYTLEDTDIYAMLDADDEMYPNKVQ